MEWSTYEFVNDFQTAIVGAFGFVSVIVTLFVNSWLARKQHKFEQVERQRTVSAGLLAEFELVRSAFKRILNAENVAAATPLVFPRLTTRLANSLTADISRLGPEAIGPTLNALFAVDEVNNLLSFSATEENETRFLLPEDAFVSIFDIVGDAILPLDNAIAALRLAAAHSAKR